MLATLSISPSQNGVTYGVIMSLVSVLAMFSAALVVVRNSTSGSKSVLWGCAFALSAINSILCGFAIQTALSQYFAGDSVLVSVSACVLLALLSFVVSEIADAECDKIFRYK